MEWRGRGVEGELGWRFWDGGGFRDGGRERGWGWSGMLGLRAWLVVITCGDGCRLHK